MNKRTKKLTKTSEFNTTKEINRAKRIARLRSRPRQPQAPLLRAAEYVPETILIRKGCSA